MMRIKHIVVTTTASLSLVLGNAAASAVVPSAGGQEIGTWINPRGSVKVQTGRCGAMLCGWVVWANRDAMDDAAAAGVPRILGTALLRNYTNTRPGNWQGQVFVPDMGKSFYSTISQSDPNSLKISGCILGGLICKSQVWHRA